MKARTRAWTAVSVTVVLAVSTLPAHAVERGAAVEDVALDGRAVVEDVTPTWTGVAVQVTPALRAELGASRGLPDHAVAAAWAARVTSGLDPAERALLATGGSGLGLEVVLDGRTGRYLSVTEPGRIGARALGITIGYLPACTTARNRSCLDRGPARLDVALSGTGTTLASFGASQRFSVRRGGSAAFTVTYPGGSSSRQSWPAGSSVSWSAPGVTVSRISH